METASIRAIETVRQIRDDHYEKTRSMSREELKAFFAHEAAAARAEARQWIHEQSTTDCSTSPAG